MWRLCSNCDDHVTWDPDQQLWLHDDGDRYCWDMPDPDQEEDRPTDALR